MKWIPASERLPEVNKDLLWRFNDRSGCGIGYNERGFNFEVVNNPLNAELQIMHIESIEWLDESPSTLPIEGEEEIKLAAATFAHEYCNKNKIEDTMDRILAIGAIVSAYKEAYKTQPQPPIEQRSKDAITPKDITAARKYWEQFRKLPIGNAEMIMHLATFRNQFKTQSLQTAIEGDGFQLCVDKWLMECFGEEISRDKVERNHRFLEEALELVQSLGCTISEAHQLVDYVFNREIGETSQETGGVMVTLAALCSANDLDMNKCGEIELARIWTKAEKIRAKQAAKPKHSPLPQFIPQKTKEGAEEGETSLGEVLTEAFNEGRISFSHEIGGDNDDEQYFKNAKEYITHVLKNQRIAGYTLAVTHPQPAAPENKELK